ncbi:hypothetical protein KR018_002968 [Drosophila ironensis]|nr:hypothetical protein KR018_002968 [Drosophila ironensis]
MAHIWCLVLLLWSIMDASAQKEKFSDINLISRVLYYYANINMLICPVAVKKSLLQIYLGSTGMSRKDLRDALGITGPNKTASVEAYYKSKLMDPKLKICSRLYVSKSVQILPRYQMLSKQLFNVTADDKSLSDHDAKNINQWLSQHTNGKINNVIDPLTILDESMKVLLINAITFRMSFANSVSVNKDNFFVAHQERHMNIKMLHVEGIFPYSYQSKLVAFVTLIPLENSSMSLALIVPRTFRGLEKTEANIAHLDLETMRRKKVKVSVTFPRFKIEYSQDMAQPLIDLGLGHIFRHADLGDMAKSKEKLKLDSILQSTYIAVDKRGVMAASHGGSK